MIEMAEQFNEVEKTVFRDLEMAVLTTTTGFRRFIDLTDFGDSLILTVDEARALRDFLNKALP